MKTQVLILDARSELELVKKFNEDKRDFFATQPLEKNDGFWVMFCYYKDDGLLSNEKPKKQLPATKQQIFYLNKHKLPFKEGTTKTEAFQIIKEHKK